MAKKPRRNEEDPQSSGPTHPTRIKKVEPLNNNQAVYLQAIENNALVIGSGPAGSGKTHLAVYQALRHHWTRYNNMRRIIIARPAVEAGEKLGFLPGTLEEKVDPYMRPIYDSLYDLLGVELAREKITKGFIEIAPLAFMRGRTFSDAFVIIDEAQNATLGQLKMAVTRVGNNCKMVITGDPLQTDLPKSQENGLVKLANIVSSVPNVAVVKFDRHDVVRSPLVIDLVAAFEDYENSQT
jgi:phosphate starvation-inducible protein PhoH and related proteins